MTYQWKVPGVIPVSADQAGEELERIWREKKTLDPRVIVAESRPGDAALHDAFEWDDEKAAEGYRCVQARTILRLIVKTVPVPDTPAVRTVRAFVRVDEGYTPMRVVLERESSTRQLLKQARRDMALFIAKYRSLRILAKMTEAMRKFLDETEDETEEDPE